MPHSSSLYATATIGQDVAHAAQLLREGQLVAVPTETVYGLAGNGLNPRAVTEIFRVKNRPFFDPLILHVVDWKQVTELVTEVPAAARTLAEACWPGPLTLLLPRSSRVPDLITAGSDRVALRMPAHPLTRDLLARLDFPLACPSANPFGYISPTQVAHVAEQLGHKIPYLLDGGPCSVGIESTIVAFAGDQVTVLRKGGVPVEELERVLGHSVSVRTHSSSQPQAPGMLQSHYAPHAPLRLVTDWPTALAAVGENDRVGVLCYRNSPSDGTQFITEVLSDQGDLAQAARHLFGALRRLDAAAPDYILAETVPDTGLGRAINDRLRRAAAQRP